MERDPNDSCLRKYRSRPNHGVGVTSEGPHVIILVLTVSSGTLPIYTYPTTGPRELMSDTLEFVQGIDETVYPKVYHYFSNLLKNREKCDLQDSSSPERSCRGWIV